MNNPKYKRIVNFEDEILRFQFVENDDFKDEILLKAGFRFLAKTFFRNDIPTEAETEYAINYIEDELMSNKKLLNNNETLFTSDEKVADLFHKNGIDKTEYTRQEIESLFNAYASVVMGKPSSLIPVKITREDFALLLTLREIMHHLDFKSIKTGH